MSLIGPGYLSTNSTYTLAPAVTGGLVVNIGADPSAQTDVDAGGFTAGVAGVSNPTVLTVVGSVFAPGDLVLVTDTTAPDNDGIYEVESHTSGPNLLTIRGIGIVPRSDDFMKDQFTTAAPVATGTVTKVSVSVLKAETDGTWSFASGDTGVLSFTTIASSPPSPEVAPTYSEVVHATSWRGPFSAPVVGDVRLTRIGRAVTADFVGTGGPSRASSAIVSTLPLPTDFRPFAPRIFMVRVTDNSTSKQGMLIVDTAGIMRFFADPSGLGFKPPSRGSNTAPTAAFQDVSVSWTT